MMKNYKQNKGYTIIETMIAISVFLVVVMAGMGALLNANLLHKKSQDMRSILDSLSFIMEEMGRNLRTGYNYKCYAEDTPWQDSFAQTPALNTPVSCAQGKTIVFEEAHGHTPATTPADPNATDQWAYKIELAAGSSTAYNISKSVDGGETWVPLNPPEVALSGASGFSVLGAESPSSISTDTLQPLVNIKLVGTITSKNIVTPFSLQTSVSERLIDI